MYTRHTPALILRQLIKIFFYWYNLKYLSNSYTTKKLHALIHIWTLKTCLSLYLPGTRRTPASRGQCPRRTTRGVPIFDDIPIYGVGATRAEATADHDRRLLALLERCRSRGIKINKDKCKLRLPEVTFKAHVTSEDGLKPDPSKIQGVREMPTPNNKQGVKRLLGMSDYLQIFASNLSQITAPRRELLKEQNQFVWDDQVQGTRFKQVKDVLPPLSWNILTAGPKLSYSVMLQTWDLEPALYRVTSR